jgi:hypothetical protein
VRWDELFADLELQLAAMATVERDAEVAERIRIEDSQITWLQRLRAQLDRELHLTVRSVGSVRGTLTRVGYDCAVLEGGQQVLLVPLAAVVSVAGLTAAADTADPAAVTSRLGLGSVLRALARDRAVVAVHCIDGQRVVGTPARVGADYLELAVHAPDEGPRPASVTARLLLPFAGLALVRPAP